MKLKVKDKIPDSKIFHLVDGEPKEQNISEVLGTNKIILFGLPGAFTATCSKFHLPGYVKNAQKILDKGIDKIFCLAVNDPYVMQAWQSQYEEGRKINMIADGNSDLTKSLELDKDYSSSFMGIRSKRFSLLADNNKINVLNIEKPGEFKISSAEYIINQI